jgi:hypothetical protein
MPNVMPAALNRAALGLLQKNNKGARCRLEKDVSPCRVQQTLRRMPPSFPIREAAEKGITPIRYKQQPASTN